MNHEFSYSLVSDLHTNTVHNIKKKITRQFILCLSANSAHPVTLLGGFLTAVEPC